MGSLCLHLGRCGSCEIAALSPLRRPPGNHALPPWESPCPPARCPQAREAQLLRTASLGPAPGPAAGSFLFPGPLLAENTLTQTHSTSTLSHIFPFRKLHFKMKNFQEKKIQRRLFLSSQIDYQLHFGIAASNYVFKSLGTIHVHCRK